MKKKLLALFLAAVMTFSAAVPAFAEESVQVAAETTDVQCMQYLSEETAFDGTASTRIAISDEDLAAAKTLESAAITVDFNTTNTGLMALAAVGGSEHTNDYISLYISGGTTVGFEIRNSSTMNVNLHEKTTLTTGSVADGKWHTITFIVAKNEGYKVYLDRELILNVSADTTYFAGTEGWWEATSVTFGGANRISGNSYLYTGSLRNAKLYGGAITEEQVMEDHANVEVKEPVTSYPEGVYKLEEYGIYDMGDRGVFNFRIPALVTTKNGVVLAAADERNDHWSDWGNIDTVVRRSTDNGLTWSDEVTVIDLESQPYNTGTQSAFLIDPVMIATESGRVWMLIDMFPESTGFGSISQTGTGYVEVDGVDYLALYDADGNQYTLRGTEVYDADGNKTSYTVDNGSAEDAFNTKGDMYDGDEYVGNIFLSSKYDGNDAAPMTPLKTIYLWLTYSDDDGQTWSNPVDITPQVKESWMKFCGTGPGFGIELKAEEHEGRLVFPIYYTNASGFQSSACIYSDDGGQTWTRGESPNDGRINSSGVATDSQNPSGVSQLTESQIIELSSGNLLQFMRNYGGSGKVAVSRSTDGGATWCDPINTSATEVYCQLSVLYMDANGTDGKDRVLMSNPGGSGRNNGTLRIGEITETESSFSVEWVEEKLFCPGNYAYSCLTRMTDGNFGLLYEHNNTIKFTAFNEAFITDETNLLSPTISSVTYDVVKTGDHAGALAGDTYVFTVTLDQEITEVKGNPQYRFEVNNELYYADFASISEDGKILTFEYIVQEGDEGHISYRAPKIICDADNYVKNAYGYTVSSGDLEVDLGYIGPDPSDASKDYPTDKITYTTGSEQAKSGNEGPISYAFDGNEDTYWHSAWTPDWYGSESCENHLWVEFELEEATVVDAIRYLQRGGNGDITGYRVEGSVDGETWTTLAEGTWTSGGGWKLAEFDAVEVVALRLVATSTVADSAANKFASARELRVRTGELSEVVAADKTALVSAIEAAEALAEADYTEESWSVLAAALSEAAAVNEKEDATQAEIDAAVEKLNAAVADLVEAPFEILDNPFDDVAIRDYYYEPVIWAYSAGITDGVADNLFGPYQGCTRGQVVTFLWRTLGQPDAVAETCKFTDVADDAYYYDAVLWAVENGITDGTSDTEFSPETICTRGHIATFLYRAVGEPEITADSCVFTDVWTGTFYYEPVIWAVENGITQGTSDTEFSPHDVCTRGQIVTFLYRAFFDMEVDPIVGSWAAEYAYYDLFEESDDALEQYMNYDNVNLVETYKFCFDNTYCVVVDVDQFLDDLNTALAEGMDAYILAYIEEMGADITPEEVWAELAAEGIYRDQVLTKEEREEIKASFGVTYGEGIYRLEDGKLFKSESLDSAITESLYETYEIVGDVLTLTGIYQNSELVENDIYPVDLYKVN